MGDYLDDELDVPEEDTPFMGVGDEEVDPEDALTEEDELDAFGMHVETPEEEPEM